MKHVSNKKQNNARKKRLEVYGFSMVLYFLAFVVMLGLIGGAVAKYYKTTSSDSVARAQWFYFTSNFLDEDGETITLSPGETEVSFTVGNHEDDLKYAEMDISFEVTVTPAVTVTCVDKKLIGKQVDDEEITLTGLQPGTTYEVTVVGKGGYTKTLKGTIKVPEATLYKYFEKTAEYVLLTIWSQGYQGSDVKITYPAGVVPDNTSDIEVMQTAKASTDNSDVTITDTKTFANSAYASGKYRFFITTADPASLTEANFVVEYSTGDPRPTADVKKPS